MVKAPQSGPAKGEVVIQSSRTLARLGKIPVSMKYGVVLYKGSLNIGDDIQSYAAMKLLPKVDYWLDRERLDRPGTNEQVKLLCNGWFMKDPLHWPPSPNLHPLFISFHISNKHNCPKLLAGKKMKPYYDQFDYVGCRDRGTEKMLHSSGIDAKYSACLTLTLDRPDVESSGEIVLVDPLLQVANEGYTRKAMKRLIPEHLHASMHWLSHQQPTLYTKPLEARIAQVEELLKVYAAAKLVITSRIHCALPCVAMGVPVIFLDVGYDRKGNRNRFDGILEFFNCINDEHFPFSSRKPLGKLVRKFGVHHLTSFRRLQTMIDWDDIPDNPKDITEVRNALVQRVHDFLNV